MSFSVTPRGGAITARGGWNSKTAYYQDDVVIWSGAEYQSLLPVNIGNQPDISGFAWIDISAGGGGGGGGVFLPFPSGGDDAPALNAAILAQPAGTTYTTPAPNLQYQVASSWVIPQAATLIGQNATVKKILSGASNFTALDCQAGGVTVDNWIIDGNQAAQPSSSGIGLRNSSTGVCVFRNVTVQNCGAGAGVLCAGIGSTQPTQLTLLFNVTSQSNIDPSNANNANGFTFSGRFRCYYCYAFNNDRHGFNVTGAIIGGTSGGCLFGGDNWAIHNGNAGFSLGNTGAASTSHAGTLHSFDNQGGGVILTGTTLWVIAAITDGFSGNAVLGNYINGTGQNPSGYGVQLFNSNDLQIASIVVRAPSGYGLSINGSGDIEINTVSVNGTTSYDGDPGMQIGGGCTDVHIVQATIEQRTRGISMGETPSGGNIVRLTVDRLITDTCTFGALVFGSNANQAQDCRFGKVTDWDSYTTDGTKPGLVEFYNALRCTIDELDQKNDGTNKPGYMVHWTANATNCSIRAIRGGVYATGFVQDLGTGNSYFVAGLAPKHSAWQPAVTNAAAVNQAIAENLGRDQVLTSALANAPTSGTMLLVGNLVLPARRTITNIMFVSGTTALAGGTNQWFCLVTFDLKIIAVTVNDVAAWAASTKKMLALNPAFTPDIDTPCWAGIVVIATTVPTLTGVNLGNTPGPLVNDVPVMSGNSSAGLTTPLAVGTSVSAPASGANTLPYVRVN